MNIGPAVGAVSHTPDGLSTRLWARCSDLGEARRPSCHGLRSNHFLHRFWEPSTATRCRVHGDSFADLSLPRTPRHRGFQEHRRRAPGLPCSMTHSWTSGPKIEISPQCRLQVSPVDERHLRAIAFGEHVHRGLHQVPNSCPCAPGTGDTATALRPRYDLCVLPVPLARREVELTTGRGPTVGTSWMRLRAASA